AAALLDLADDATADVVAGEELRRPARRLVALRIAPALFLVVGGLPAIVLGDVVEHEAPAFGVFQDAALAADAFGNEDAAHARRPDHSGRMELHELHVHQLGARIVGERMPVAGVLPAVAGDLVGAADAAGGEDDRFGAEHLEAAALALVAERADHAAAVFEQPDDRALHVHVNALMNAVILEGADHLEPGPVAGVREPRIAVAAEVALEDAAVLRAIEHRAPGLELADPVGRFLGVQLRHPPVVDVLAAAHRIGEVHLPAVAIVDIGERRRDTALGHHRVRLAEQRLADESDRHAACRRFDRRAQPS